MVDSWSLLCHVISLKYLLPFCVESYPLFVIFFLFAYGCFFSVFFFRLRSFPLVTESSFPLVAQQNTSHSSYRPDKTHRLGRGTFTIFSLVSSLAWACNIFWEGTPKIWDELHVCIVPSEVRMANMQVHKPAELWKNLRNLVACEVVHIASVVVCIVEFESAGWPKKRRKHGWKRWGYSCKGMLCFLITSWRQICHKWTNLSHLNLLQASKWNYPTCLPLHIALCWWRFLVATRSGLDFSW